MRSKQGGQAPLHSSASASQQGLRFALVCLRPCAPLIQWLRHPIRGAWLLRLLGLRSAPVSSAFAPRQGGLSPLLSICIYICNLHLPIVYIAKFTSVNPNGYAGCALPPRCGVCNTAQHLRSAVPLRPLLGSLLPAQKGLARSRALAVPSPCSFSPSSALGEPPPLRSVCTPRPSVRFVLARSVFGSALAPLDFLAQPTHPAFVGGFYALLVLTSSESPLGSLRSHLLLSLRSPILARSPHLPAYPRIAFARSEVGAFPLINLKLI